MRALIAVAALAIASQANATQMDCAGCGCTKTCTVESYSVHGEGSTKTKEYVKFDGIKPVVFIAAKRNHKRDDYQHCTAQDEYDTLYTAIGAGNGEGYTLDQDGSTIWSADRSERIYRCAPQRFDKDKSDHLAGSLSGYGGGYWREVITYWERTTEYLKVVCTVWQNGTNDGGGGSTTPTPEPSTMMLFGAGLAGVAVINRRRK